MTQPPRKLRIVLLNQAFYPDVVATAQMGKDLADALVERGHEVIAIASRSIYGKAGATLPRRESLRAPGGTIDIRRVGFSLFGKRGTLTRLLDFGFFYILAAFRLLTLPRCDIVVGFSTPPYIAMLGLLARLFRGSRCVYWAMDLYPDVPVAFGMLRSGAPHTRLLAWAHRLLLRRADVTVSLGRCMEERLLAGGAPKQRLRVIPVWADETDVRDIPPEQNSLRRAWNLTDAFCVMYSGNFGLGHDAATVCSAMEKLRGESAVRFLFVGGGKRRAEIESFIRERGITNASYVDYVPRAQLAESLSAGDAHLITLREDMTGLIVPSKLYGIMAAARPVLFVGAATSEVGRVVAESGCGTVVRPGDADALADAIRRLAHEPALARDQGRRGRAAFDALYTRSRSCAAWIETLEALSAARASP